jgi:hypothetical protein
MKKGSFWAELVGLIVLGIICWCGWVLLHLAALPPTP